MCISRGINALGEQLLLIEHAAQHSPQAGNSSSSSSTQLPAANWGSEALTLLPAPLMLMPAAANTSVSNAALTEQQLQQMLHEELSLPTWDQQQQQLDEQDEVLQQIVLRHRWLRQQVELNKQMMMMSQRLQQQPEQVAGVSAAGPLNAAPFKNSNLPGRLQQMAGTFASTGYSSAPGTGCSTAPGVGSSTALGAGCSTAPGTGCGSALTGGCSAAPGIGSSTAPGISCSTALGAGCSSAPGINANTGSSSAPGTGCSPAPGAGSSSLPGRLQEMAGELASMHAALMQAQQLFL
jgi:hypothetical protein